MVYFRMYSTYTYLLLDTNPWQYCNYNVPYVGYPADCAVSVNTTSSIPDMWTGFASDTQSSIPQSTEIWMQVFPNSKPYTTDLIQNGDFEAYGSNFSNYDIPVGWQVASQTSSNKIATIQATMGTVPYIQGVALQNEIGSHCGISHVLIIKPAGKPFGGIKQSIYVPAGFIFTLKIRHS